MSLMNSACSSTIPRRKWLTVILSLVMTSVLPLLPARLSSASDVPFVRNGEVSFVVSHIQYGLSLDAAETDACPNGMSKNLQEIYALRPEGQQRPDEKDRDYMKRLRGVARAMDTSDDGRPFCLHPELAPADKHFRAVQRSDIPVFGIDLDGCNASNDFPGIDGNDGVDNQWYRMTGCLRSYQSTGQSNAYEIGMLTGSWGILIKLEGVDDIRNDEHIDIHLYANSDPIRLSPSRDALAFATYTATASPKYRATTTGRIVDGVLMSDPVDAQFHNEVNSMYLDRPLKDAQLQVTLSQDGAMSGYLSGYTPIEAMYDMQFGFRSGRTSDGDLAPESLRSHTASGAAFVLGHTCRGAYQALYAYADGHPDPDTGRFTSISTQYRIEAVPAFVVEPTDCPEEACK